MKAPESKKVLLLIEIFRKLINPQNYGHLDPLQVAFYHFRGSKNLAFQLNSHPPNNVRGQIRISVL